LRVQQGNLRDVDARLRQTVAPEHPDALLVLEALARGYIATDRLADATQACDLWISRQPDHPWPWLWRGEIFERMGHKQAALGDYLKALENAPDDRDVRLALGRLLAETRRSDVAAEHFEHVLRRHPDEQEALLGLAGCQVDQGRLAEAISLLQRISASANNGAVAARGFLLHGRIALAKDDPAAAEFWLRQVVGLAPDHPEALHQLITALRAQNKNAEADKLAPRLETMRRDLARLTELIAMIARHPEDADVRGEAGTIALRLGRADDGVRLLESALRLRGDHRAAHAALAQHYGALGDPRAGIHRRLATTP
jgi:tetratricopeptide (TPR) repeat protein